jgi:hypothetical protein
LELVSHRFHVPLLGNTEVSRISRTAPTKSVGWLTRYFSVGLAISAELLESDLCGLDWLLRNRMYVPAYPSWDTPRRKWRCLLIYRSANPQTCSSELHSMTSRELIVASTASMQVYMCKKLTLHFVSRDSYRQHPTATNAVPDTTISCPSFDPDDDCNLLYSPHIWLSV